MRVLHATTTSPTSSSPFGEDLTTPTAFISFDEMGLDTWDKSKYDGGLG
jgi:hypothetical protein